MNYTLNKISAIGLLLCAFTCLVDIEFSYADDVGEEDTAAYPVKNCWQKGGEVVKKYDHDGWDTLGHDPSCNNAIAEAINNVNNFFYQDAIDCQTFPGWTELEVNYSEGEPSLNSCTCYGVAGCTHQRGSTFWCCSYGECGNNKTEWNDVVQEECDDGNTVSNDGCSSTCLLETSNPNPSESPSGSSTPLPSASSSSSPMPTP